MKKTHHRQQHSSNRRRFGDMDTTDLLVGLALAIVIPVVFATIISICGLPLTMRQSTDVAVKVRIEPPPLTREEIQELHTVSSKILDESASHYLNLWRNETDGVAKIKQGRWAKMSLEESKTNFDLLIKSFSKARANYAGLEGLLSQSQTRVQEIDRLIAELEKEDTLNQY